MFKDRVLRKNGNCNKPVHVTPSPVYPLLQSQVNDPSVLVQLPLTLSQLSKPLKHSSMSRKRMDK